MRAEMYLWPPPAPVHLVLVPVSAALWHSPAGAASAAGAELLDDITAAAISQVSERMVLLGVNEADSTKTTTSFLPAFYPL